MLHITIGTAPVMPPTLEPDLRMVKVALLYADKVKLCSAGYSAWMPELLDKDKTTEQLIKETFKMEEMIPYLVTEKDERIFQITIQRTARKLLLKDNLTKEESEIIDKYRKISLFFETR